MRLVFNPRSMSNCPPEGQETFILTVFYKDEPLEHVYFEKNFDLVYIDLDNVYSELSFKVTCHNERIEFKKPTVIKNSRDLRRLAFDGISREMLEDEKRCILERKYLKLSWVEDEELAFSEYEEEEKMFFGSQNGDMGENCSEEYETIVSGITDGTEEVYIDFKWNGVAVTPKVVATKENGVICRKDSSFTQTKRLFEKKKALMKGYEMYL